MEILDLSTKYERNLLRMYRTPGSAGPIYKIDSSLDLVLHHPFAIKFSRIIRDVAQSG